MILIGAECACHHAAIAQPMKNRLSPVKLHTADDVRVMSEDNVGTGIDGRMGNRPLIRRQAHRGMDDALVQGDHEKVSILFCGSDILLHCMQRLWCSVFKSGGRRNGAAVRGLDPNKSKPGRCIRCPAVFRADAVITEDRDLFPVNIQHRRSARLAQIGTRPRNMQYPIGEVPPWCR